MNPAKIEAAVAEVTELIPHGTRVHCVTSALSLPPSKIIALTLLPSTWLYIEHQREL